MASISTTHKSWAKLIIDTIEQQETDEQHVAVYQKIMFSKDTRAGAIRAATKGICTILLSKNPPFVEVSRASSSKFEEELKILHNYFVRNPTPAVRFDLNDSEDDDASEIDKTSSNRSSSSIGLSNLTGCHQCSKCSRTESGVPSKLSSGQKTSKPI